MRLVGNLLITGFSLAVLGLAISFTASNDTVVTLSLWPFTMKMSLPLWLVGLGGFGFGLVLGGLAMSLPLMASRWQQNRLNRKLRVMEKQQAARQDEDDKPMLPKS
ncbi:MAG: lipopolysaccharide assembly protein LapA domain-containing protein [Candidatus Puniceispirillales bacterium]